MANVVCPSCGAAGRVPDNFLGRRIKCPKCQEPFTAAATPAAPSSKAVKPPAEPAPSSPRAAAPPPVSVARRRAPAPPPPPAEEDILEEVPEDEEVVAEEAEDAPAPSGGGIDYMRPFRYVFAKPTWMKNAFMAGLCGLIPVVGTLCVIGYGYEVVAALHRKGRDTSYPDFDFGKFGAYLMRGLWPLLVGFIVSFAVMVPLWAIQFALTLVLAGHAPAIVLSLLSVAIMAVFVALMVLLQPMFLRAGLSQGLDLGGSIRFARDFLKRVGLQLLLGMLVVGFLGGLLNMLGMIACCVGTVITSPVVTLAFAHLQYQLYELHLARGGEEVPIKESTG